MFYKFPCFSNDLNEWYRVTGEDVRKIGHEAVIRTYYNGSLLKALESVYPHHKFIAWKFVHSPHNYFAKKETHKYVNV